MMASNEAVFLLLATILAPLVLWLAFQIYEFFFWRKAVKEISFEVEQALRDLDEMNGDTREHDYHAESIQALEQVLKEMDRENK